MTSSLRPHNFTFKHKITKNHGVFNLEVKAFSNGKHVAAAYFTHDMNFLSCLKDVYEMTLPTLHNIIQLNFIERSDFGSHENKFKGLGHNLLCYSLKLLEKHGFKHIILKAVKQKLVPFYISIGFKQLQPEEERYMISKISTLKQKCIMEWMR